MAVTKNQDGTISITREVVKEETRTVKSLEVLLREKAVYESGKARIQANLDRVNADIAAVQAIEEK